jgi:hypothetical protein
VAGESARESARRQREKAERLLRAAELNERGALGEEATAIALAALPSETWTVLHDLRWPGRKYANVDHVVIGPPGVFVIDSKNWSGRIMVRDDVLRCSGYRREREVAGAAEAALAVAGLTNVVGPDLVHPVLCFVRDEPLAGKARDVMICSSRNVVEMLTSRPPRLTAQQVRDVSLQLDAQLVPAGSKGQTPISRPSARQGRLTLSDRMPAPRPPKRPARRRSRRRNEPSVARLLLGLVLLGVLILAPGVVTGLGAAVAQLLVRQ